MQLRQRRRARASAPVDGLAGVCACVCARACVRACVCVHARVCVYVRAPSAVDGLAGVVIIQVIYMNICIC